MPWAFPCLSPELRPWKPDGSADGTVSVNFFGKWVLFAIAGLPAALLRIFGDFGFLGA
jgi:hypothetical protein